MARRSQTPSSAPAERADELGRRLARLKRAQLEALLRRLLVDHPDLRPAIYQRLGELDTAPDLSKPSETSRTRKQGPDTAKLRRELRSLWRGLGPYETYAYVDVARASSAP